MSISFSKIFWGIICLIIGFFLIYGSWAAYSEYRRVQGYVGQGVGTVINKYYEQSSDGSANYYIEYSFMPTSEAPRIVSKSIMIKHQWDSLEVDDNLDIRFDESNPARSIPLYGGSPSLLFGFFMVLMALVFIFFGSGRIVAGMKRAERKTSSS